MARSVRAPTDPGEAVKRARAVLAVSAVVTLLIHIVPFGDIIGRPLLYISTLVHELGHGITAILVGGDFDKLEMWSDGSGLASSYGKSGAQHALVATGGLVGPAIAAAVGFVLARRRKWARVGLGVIGAVLLWAMVFKIRTAFGLLIAGGLAAACIGVALRATADWAQLFLGFLSVQLALSVFSGSGYLFMETATTGGGTGPSDSGIIAQMVGGPYWLWGALCGAISLAALAFGAWAMLRGVGSRQISGKNLPG